MERRSGSGKGFGQYPMYGYLSDTYPSIDICKKFQFKILRLFLWNCKIMLKVEYFTPIRCSVNNNIYLHIIVDIMTAQSISLQVCKEMRNLDQFHRTKVAQIVFHKDISVYLLSNLRFYNEYSGFIK